MNLLLIALKEGRKRIGIHRYMNRVYLTIPIPFPISLITLSYVMLTENRLRFFGFDYRPTIIIKIAFKQLASLYREKNANIHTQLHGQTILVSTARSFDYDELKKMVYSVFNFIGEKSCWISRSFALRHQKLVDSPKFEDALEKEIYDIFFLHDIRKISQVLQSTRKRIKSELSQKFLYFSDQVSDSRTIKFLDIAKAKVPNGSYVLTDEVILPTSPYYVDELARELPSPLPIVNSAKNLFSIKVGDFCSVPKGLFVGSSPNFYHVMWENVPRALAYFEARNHDYGSLPCIIPATLPTSIIEIFEVSAGVRPILCKIGSEIEVGNLVVTFDGRYLERVNYETYREGNIFCERELDKKRLINLKKSLMKDTSLSQLDIFVIRPFQDSRSPKNLNDLENYFSMKGYAIVEPSKLSFKEQVELFSRARKVCAIAGASLTNLVFSEAASKVVILSVADENDIAARIFWPQYMEFLGLNYSLYVLNNGQDFDLGLLELMLDSKLQTFEGNQLGL